MFHGRCFCKPKRVLSLLWKRQFVFSLHREQRPAWIISRSKSRTEVPSENFEVTIHVKVPEARQLDRKGRFLLSDPTVLCTLIWHIAKTKQQLA